MPDWTSTTLGEICANGHGGIQTGPFGSQLHAEEYAPVGIPVVMPQDLGDNTISTAQIARVPEAVAARLGRHRLAVGDIVFSRRGDVTRRALVRDSNADWLCGTGCLRVRPGNAVDSTFLSYLLGTADAKAWLLGNAVGTNMLNLNTTILGRLPLAVPPLSEQQAIAEVLGALDDKIAANTALAATADLYASTVLLGSLGAGRVRLASVAHITMGSSPKGDTLNELGQGVPFYQGVRDFGFRSPTRRVFTTAPVRSANAGDILVSVRAPVGDVNVADEPVCIGRGIAAVRSTTGTQATLLHQLKAERNAWEPFEAEGTVFGSINRDQLHGIQLHVVPPERVEFVEAELAAIESSIAATLAENRTLAATRDALLPQLMSGKLRVRDIGRTASGVEA